MSYYMDAFMLLVMHKEIRRSLVVSPTVYTFLVLL